jgi:RNA-directed DNA polymerase
VVEVEAQLFRGHPEVVDADLADYFGSIPHAELLKSVARRIVDRRVLHLIKMWLECPVEETDDRGRKTRTTEARDNRRGIPQGSPISPLLANLYMRRFVLGWKMLGLEQSLGSRIVTYADDLVILCRRGKAEEALQQLRKIMSKLKLTVNEDKTRICKVPEEEFDFLGYSFGRMYSARKREIIGCNSSRNRTEKRCRVLCCSWKGASRRRVAGYDRHLLRYIQASTSQEVAKPNSNRSRGLAEGGGLII